MYVAIAGRRERYHSYVQYVIIVIITKSTKSMLVLLALILASIRRKNQNKLINAPLSAQSKINCKNQRRDQNKRSFTVLSLSEYTKAHTVTIAASIQKNCHKIYVFISMFFNVLFYEENHTFSLK